jgi:hypothetical protein
MLTLLRQMMKISETSYYKINKIENNYEFDLPNFTGKILKIIPHFVGGIYRTDIIHLVF